MMVEVEEMMGFENQILNIVRNTNKDISELVKRAYSRGYTNGFRRAPTMSPTKIKDLNWIYDKVFILRHQYDKENNPNGMKENFINPYDVVLDIIDESLDDTKID